MREEKGREKNTTFFKLCQKYHIFHIFTQKIHIKNDFPFFSQGCLSFFFSRNHSCLSFFSCKNLNEFFIFLHTSGKSRERNGDRWFEIQTWCSISRLYQIDTVS